MSLNSPVKVTWYPQSESHCGPASLKIALSHFGKESDEAELGRLAKTTKENGTEHTDMIAAARAMGASVFAKEQGTIDELAYFTKEKGLPVIVGWFDRDDDHYSVVTDVTDTQLIMADPAHTGPERLIERLLFPKIWFDFVGEDNKIVSWGWYMVVSDVPLTPGHFKIPGGTYYPLLQKS